MLIGIDIEDVVRFRSAQKNKLPAYLRKIYTDRELDYCFSKDDPAPHLAARFAGKEAVLKALDRHGKLHYTDIEVLNNPTGCPMVSLRGDDLKHWTVKISLSHTAKVVVAVAIVFK